MNERPKVLVVGANCTELTICTNWHATELTVA